jgi:hypothetical protein
MKYGITFWGNSTDNKRVFQLQKEILKNMARPKIRISSKPLLTALAILTAFSVCAISNDFFGT